MEGGEERAVGVVVVVVVALEFEKKFKIYGR